MMSVTACYVYTSLFSLCWCWCTGGTYFEGMFMPKCCIHVYKAQFKCLPHNVK